MPLQNRVTPFGDLVAAAARGTVMGNRGGMFHDPGTRALSGRRWSSRRWLCCALDFPGSHRHPVWSRGYTQLFFLDEVTALAAGHRPCAECRRTAARAFQAAADVPSLAALDLRLHAERLDGRRQRRWRAPIAELPDGAIVAVDGVPHARRAGRLLAWSHGGYGSAAEVGDEVAEVLTPPLTLAALRAGYRPLWHPTARGGGQDP